MSKIRTWLSVAGALLLASLGAAAQPPPGDSLYQLQTPLRTQRDEAVKLDLYSGHPLLVSMFYTRCGYVCPLLLRSLQRLDAGLDPAVRERVRVLVVSLDPAHDTPQVLQATAQKHGVDGARWTLAQASAADVRKLAAALGIQYRQLPDGGFNHATVITLLAPDGRVLARTSNPSAPEESFVSALQQAAAATP